MVEADEGLGVTGGRDKGEFQGDRWKEKRA